MPVTSTPVHAGCAVAATTLPSRAPKLLAVRAGS